MGRKLREHGAVPLLGGAATPFNTTSPGPRFTSVPITKWHLDPSIRLVTTDIGRNYLSIYLCANKAADFIAPFIRAYEPLRNWRISP